MTRRLQSRLEKEAVQRRQERDALVRAIEASENEGREEAAAQMEARLKEVQQRHDEKTADAEKLLLSAREEKEAQLYAKKVDPLPPRPLSPALALPRPSSPSLALASPSTLSQELEKELASSKDDAEVANEMFNKHALASRPLQDASVHVDEQLFGKFKAELEDSHRVRILGEFDIDHMLALGLRDDDENVARRWNRSYLESWLSDANYPHRVPYEPHPYWDKHALFCAVSTRTNAESLLPNKTLKGVFGKSICSDTTVHHINEDHPWVRAFRKRYRGQKGDSLLAYMKHMYEEYENSAAKVSDFKQVITTCCSRRTCYLAGKCSGGTRLEKGAMREKDGWILPIEKTMMQPIDKLKLLIDLTVVRCHHGTEPAVKTES